MYLYLAENKANGLALTKYHWFNSNASLLVK